MPWTHTIPDESQLSKFILSAESSFCGTKERKGAIFQLTRYFCEKVPK